MLSYITKSNSNKKVEVHFLKVIAKTWSWRWGSFPHCPHCWECLEQENNVLVTCLLAHVHDVENRAVITFPEINDMLNELGNSQFLCLILN